jgi:hypothetical protein
MVPDPSAEHDCPVSAAAIGAARIATAAASAPNSGVVQIILMRIGVFFSMNGLDLASPTMALDRALVAPADPHCRVH